MLSCPPDIDSNILTIGDTHFNHANIIGYCNRPFGCIEEHDETIINNWNKITREKDIIIHVGDFGFGHKRIIQGYLDRLSGNLILIKGNHDRFNEVKWKRLGIKLFYKHQLDFPKQQIMFRHKPDYKYINKVVIHGHIHQHKSKRKNYINVSVEQTEYRPLFLEERITSNAKILKIKKQLLELLNNEDK